MATETDTVTDINSWKKKQSKPLELPSGNRARVRGGSMQFFLTAGFIPNSLKSMIQKAISEVDLHGGKSVELDDGSMADILNDEAKLQELMDLYDKVAIYCFQEPKLHPVPPEEEERDEDLLYVDEVDFEDKVFVFNYAVGGTRDLERFREQQNTHVESVRAGAAVEGEA